MTHVGATSRRCTHCGSENLVAECGQDARPFVLTTSHLQGRMREFDDGPVQHLPADFELPLCDFCASRAAGLGPTDTIGAALRQATCPVCRIEFLSDA